MPPDRWFGVGFCEGAREAGASAADDALVHDDPKLLIVFCSQAHDLWQLLRQVRERAGDVPLIGCTTAGQIATDGPSDGGVVVAALGGKGFAVRTTVAAEASRNLREAGAHVARGLPDRADLPHRVVLLLSDGGLIAFDCVARRAVLGEEGIQSEIGRLATMASGAPVAGCYTYGEIARTRGVRGFHNQTLVLLSIG